jgi:hypothetical protein
MIQSGKKLIIIFKVNFNIRILIGMGFKVIITGIVIIFEKKTAPELTGAVAKNDVVFLYAVDSIQIFERCF